MFSLKMSNRILYDRSTKIFEKLFLQIYLIKFNQRKIILSILLSLLLGTIIGFIFLSMFINIGGDEPELLPPVVTEKENEKISEEDNYSGDVELKTLSAYVLQAGMFSDEENAKKALKAFQEENLPSVLWFKDSHYYIFLGVSFTKEDGDTLKEEMIPDTIDVYVKEWFVPSKTIHVIEEDAKFLKEFVTLWKDSVKESTNIKRWEQLFHQDRHLDAMKPFLERIQEEFSLVEEEELSFQQFLLSSWQLYDTFTQSLEDER